MSEAPEPRDRRLAVLAAVGAGTFMSALDGSVVNTLLPVLRRDLGASVAGIEWVTAVYLLVVSALLLGVGRAGDLHGHKRLYVSGFVGFVAGSALCGLAPSGQALVATRALQGIGAAMLFANAPAILTKAFPVSQRGRALGAQGTMTYLGLTVGPSLGGWMAATFGWRSVFYINIPVGALAIALALRVIEDDRPTRRPEPFDLRGAALFSAGLSALLLALNQGHAWGWASARTLVLLGGAGLLLAAFLHVERGHSSPMLDLRLFRSRRFSGATAAAVLNYVAVYSVLFVLPFLLIQGRGLDPRQAGLVLTAQPLVMALVAPLSGALSDRVGTRAPAAVGMSVLAGGLLLLARAAALPGLTGIVTALGVVGLGVGTFASPNSSGLLGAAPRDRQGIAAGVLATARNVGMALGIGVAGAVFTTTLARAGPGALVAGVQASLLAAAAIAALGAACTLARDRG